MKKRIGILVAVALIFLTGIIGGGTLIHNHSSNSSGGLLPGGSVPWATPGSIGSTTPNTGAFTSVISPLIQTTSGALQFSSATGVISTNSDNTTLLGDSTHRWITLFTGGVDTGTTGSLALRTNNGSNQFIVDHTAGTVVNTLHATGGVTGNPPILQALGDTNVGIRFVSSGTGTIAFEAPGGTTQFSIAATPSSSRNLVVAGSAAGDPTLTATAGNIGMGSPVNFTASASSTKACAANYTRIGPNYCLWTAATPAATAITTSCTSIAAPAGAKVVLIILRITVKSSGTVSTLNSATLTGYNDATCVTGILLAHTASLFEFVAATAGTTLNTEQTYSALPVVSGNAVTKLTIVSGGASIADATIQGYFD